MSARPIPLINPVVRERFEAKVAKAGPDDCWPWKGAKSGSGYGGFSIDGAMFQAHRVSVKVAGYSVPDKAVIDHVCRNRLCVNPAHLRTVDHMTNVHENSASPSHLNSLKTHCPNGHSYSGDNLAIRTNGRRGCRSCNAEYQRKRRAAGEADESAVGPQADAP